MKKKNLPRITFVTVTAALLVVGAALTLTLKRHYAVKPDAKAPQDATAAWHVYENKTFGFSLRWPEGILPGNPSAYDGGLATYAYIPVHSNLDIYVGAQRKGQAENTMEGAVKKYVALPEEKQYANFVKKPFTIGNLPTTWISYLSDDGKKNISILYENSAMRLLLVYKNNQPDFGEALFEKVAGTLAVTNPVVAVAPPETSSTQLSQPPTVPAAPYHAATTLWRTYRNDEDGYTLQYPADFIAGEGVPLKGDELRAVGTTFSIPARNIQASQFYSASIHITAGKKEMCGTASDETISTNGVPFHRIEKQEEDAAGRAVSETAYATLRGETCYRFILRGETRDPNTALGNAEDAARAKSQIQEDEQGLRATLERMLGTLTFTDQETTTAGPVRIESISPSPLTIGNQFTIKGQGFAAQPAPENFGIGWTAHSHVVVTLTDEAGNTGIVWAGSPDAASDTELVATLPSRLCKTAAVCEPALDVIPGETYVLTVAIPYLNLRSNIPVTTQKSD